MDIYFILSNNSNIWIIGSLNILLEVSANFKSGDFFAYMFGNLLLWRVTLACS